MKRLDSGRDSEWGGNGGEGSVAHVEGSSGELPWLRGSQPRQRPQHFKHCMDHCRASYNDMLRSRPCPPFLQLLYAEDPTAADLELLRGRHSLSIYILAPVLARPPASPQPLQPHPPLF